MMPTQAGAVVRMWAERISDSSSDENRMIFDERGPIRCASGYQDMQMRAMTRRIEEHDPKVFAMPSMITASYELHSMMYKLTYSQVNSRQTPCTVD